MEKYRLIGIGLVLGTIIAAIIFFLGITYISGTITFIISITIATLLLFGYFLIKYNAKRNIEIDKHEEKVKKLASEIKSIFPTLANEQSLKELISSSVKSIRNIYTSTFLLSTFFSLSMVIVGLLASVIAIKQNNTMRDQNYLICQQNQYLETNIKYNLFSDPNKSLYTYIDTIKKRIQEENKLLKQPFDYIKKNWSSSDILPIKNIDLKFFYLYLPQTQYDNMMILRENLTKNIRKNDFNKVQFLAIKYKFQLADFLKTLDNMKEKLEIKAKKEKINNLLKTNMKNCNEYNN